MKIENRQAHTLFGIVLFFLLGNSIRIFLNLQEFFASAGLEVEDSFQQEEQIEDYKSKNTTLMFDQVDPECVTFSLTIMLLKSVSGVLLSFSHAGNLVIYCTANDLFRRIIVKKTLKYVPLTRHCFILVNGEQAFIDLEQQTQGRSSQRFHQYSNRMNGSIQRGRSRSLNHIRERSLQARTISIIQPEAKSMTNL